VRLDRRRFSLFALLATLGWRGAVSASAATEDFDATEVLALAANTLFPHKNVSLAHYQIVAAAFLTSNTSQAERLAVVLGSADFVSGPTSRRETLLGRIEHTPDFLVFRFHALMMLYNDLALTREFGYQGASIQHGGYLARGFDDIDWLPHGEA
jgi:hypothetical protein